MSTKAIDEWRELPYEDHAVLQALYTLELLIAAMTRLLRPPSYATMLERSLRGWMWEPATRGEIMQLLDIGTIDFTNMILRQSRYASRRQELATFLKALTSGVARRKEIWHRLLYYPYEPSEQEVPSGFWETTGQLPLTASVGQCLWEKAQELEEYDIAWTIPKTYVSNLLGYDIVERLRQSQTLQETVQGRTLSEEDLEELRATDELAIRQSDHGDLDAWWVDHQKDFVWFKK